MGDLALLDCVHGIGSAAFSLFLDRIDKKRNQLCGAPDLFMVEDAEREEEDPAKLFSLAKSAHRKGVEELVNRGGIRYVVVLRKALGPLFAFLSEQMEIGGVRWKLERSAKVLHGELKRQGSPFQVAADCELELRHASRVKTLLGKDEWQLLLPELRTLDTQHLIFRLLHRQLGLVEMLSVQDNNAYPLCWWKSFNAPDSVVELSRECHACCMDAWSLALCKYFRTLPCTEFLAVLEAVGSRPLHIVRR